MAVTHTHTRSMRRAPARMILPLAAGSIALAATGLVPLGGLLRDYAEYGIVAVVMTLGTACWLAVKRRRE